MSAKPAVLIAASSLLLPLVAVASKSKPPPPDSPDSAQRTSEILAAIEEGGATKDQLARIDDLVTLSPTATNVLVAFLGRQHKTSIDARRALLTEIGADVPDEKGRFRSPGRESDKTKEDEDKFDWAAKLLELEQSRASREALADIAAIRALARSEDPRGALAALEFAFTQSGSIYRDEVGRYLRKGSPWSIPGLIRGAHARSGDVSRYANYQLERIDRQAPHKAVRAAEISETLQLAVFKAFADTLYREAIYTVLDNVDDDVDTIRAAARAALDAYVTKDPPRPPPKKKLTMAGGDLTKKPVPLYLSHKEIADIELRRRLEELTGKAPAAKASLVELKEALYQHYDNARDRTLAAIFEAGRAAAEGGDLAAAIAKFDEVLAQMPEHSERAAMAPIYLRYGSEKLAAGDHKTAVVALTKAHELDPDGKHAAEAESKALVARAKMIEAAGGDSSAEMARARELDPDAGKTEGPTWMLFIGIGGALAGILLLIAGAMVRRRR